MKNWIQELAAVGSARRCARANAVSWRGYLALLDIHLTLEFLGK